VLRALVFDLDGVLLDSEQLWDAARRSVAADHGGEWRDDVTDAMQGMSSPEWSRYMHEELGMPISDEEIVDLVVSDLLARYERELPLVAGAVEAVRRLGERWPLGLASSSNRVVIDRALALADLRQAFRVTVSSEEVARGKPSPDVYLAAALALDAVPDACAAVEDSANGIRAALAARMHVVVVPNPQFPPPVELLGQADLVVGSLDQLTVAALETIDGADAMVDEEEVESFPASDPHSDWAGGGG
jgi:HAD superfamily hydrolase (TIGR01509 family)